MTDYAQKLAAVEGYVAAFAAGDADAVAALYADNATVEDPVGTPLVEGIDAVRAFYAGAMQTGAKLELLGEPRGAGDYVAFPFAVHLEHEGGHRVIEVIDTFKFDADGKVVEMRAFWGRENVKSL